MTVTLPESIKEPEDVDYAKVLLYGPTGVGKTTFLGSAMDDERTSPILILSYEAGTRVLKGTGAKIWPIQSWEDFAEAYDYLANEDHPFKSIGVDSLSEVHVFALLDILDEQEDHRRKTNRNPDLLEQGDYGTAAVQMRKLVRRFRDLPLHVFFTAIAKPDVEPGIGTIYKPSFSGKIADEVPGIVDFCVYMTLVELEGSNGESVSGRAFILRDYPEYRTKFRIPIGETYPKEIINPTVTSLLNAAKVN